jgi:hypothetical protein
MVIGKMIYNKALVNIHGKVLLIFFYYKIYIFKLNKFIILLDGRVYEGQFKNGISTGTGIHTYKGAKYDGQFLNGLRNGKGKFLYANNKNDLFNYSRY